MFSQLILEQEDFTNYLGTVATVPAGWNFSYQGNYTSVASCGTSGPNAYKFGVNLATINTPPFSNADTVQFWVKGLSTDAVSMLVCLESPDSLAWDTIGKVQPIPTTGTVFKYHVSSAAHHLRFTYVKSAGNVSFDDYRLLQNSVVSNSTGTITVYFNHPVNTAVSSGINAVYLNQTIDDTLIAYINRAKFTLDIAVYNYIQTASISNIATAINNAYARGVKIRWIYNGSSSNSGLSLLNSGIPKLGSPTSASYNIMHNKFMIVDAHSSNVDDPIVWTGSTNWDDQQINSDYNNVIIIRDKNLATAYTTEFNEMWGDTGMVANTTNSRFGPFKTDNTPHTFTIGTRTVELYFSPSDGVNNQILNKINSANNSLFFGVYTFTESSDANAIVARQSAGVYTAGIIDQNSTPYSAYPILNSGLGSMLEVYSNATFLYHNKFLIVDECDSTSDPLVLTGSHNWTATADTKNDENTVIVHSVLIANEYYQSFNMNFSDLGGSLGLSCITTSLSSAPIDLNSISVFPVPASEMINVKNIFGGNVKIRIYDTNGQLVMEMNGADEIFSAGVASLPDGMYFIAEEKEGNIANGKFIIQR
ncbi:MAG: T9SS type A sorting domain-containing protein [Bacteroidetes bacterium]|nr:T9SS type A sorting domain-containing protein [Bacteroidota bacterium]